MSVAGPSHFAEISSLTVTPLVYSTGSSSAAAITVYSVNSVSLTQSATMVYGMDNTKAFAVSAHAAAKQVSVSVSTNDVAGLKSLQAYYGTIVKIAFTWKASSAQLTTTALLADQTVTINNVCLTNVDPDAASKGLGSGRLSGVCLQMSDNSDPVVYS